MSRTIFLFFLLVLAAGSVSAQTEQITAKQLRATQKLTLDTVTLTRILKTISVAATHNDGVTGKAVYDYVQSVAGSITTTARLSGSGTSGSPLDIAQQGATTGQVLRWSGTAWTPNGINLYDVVTSSGTVDIPNNQIWVGTLGAAIALNLPACNAGNNGVKFEIIKAGGDTYKIDIEPAGSEIFSDGASVKSIYSLATGLSCTCRWNGSTGYWLFHNL